MDCALTKLAVSSSRFDFTNSNYNYDNSNANVSFHLCNCICSADHAHMAKKNDHKLKSTGTEGEGDLLMAKAVRCKISSWGCVYHACMTDDCQKKEVLKYNKSWGKGDCEKKR